MHVQLVRLVCCSARQRSAHKPATRRARKRGPWDADVAGWHMHITEPHSVQQSSGTSGVQQPTGFGTVLNTRLACLISNAAPVQPAAVAAETNSI
jgi:hypothetical protein